MANEAPPPAATVATVSKCHSQSNAMLSGAGSAVLIDIDEKVRIAYILVAQIRLNRRNRK